MTVKFAVHSFIRVVNVLFCLFSLFNFWEYYCSLHVVRAAVPVYKTLECSMLFCPVNFRSEFYFSILSLKFVGNLIHHNYVLFSIVLYLIIFYL